jgi:hypothetical protein
MTKRIFISGVESDSQLGHPRLDYILTAELAQDYLGRLVYEHQRAQDDCNPAPIKPIIPGPQAERGRRRFMRTPQHLEVLVRDSRSQAELPVCQ